MLQVRTATTADAKAIQDIYAPYILSSACTFEAIVPPINEFENRIERCLQNFPWIVCETNDGIGGYVYASRHREREAYQWTCECSVYIHQHFKGKGLGLALYRCLFAILKQQGLVNVYAGITLPNDASVRLHEKCGFEHFATYHNVGYKLGNWHKVGWWRLQLNDYQLNPSPPLKFAQLNQQQLSHLLAQTSESIKLY